MHHFLRSAHLIMIQLRSDIEIVCYIAIAPSYIHQPSTSPHKASGCFQLRNDFSKTPDLVKVTTCDEAVEIMHEMSLAYTLKIS